MKKKKEIIISFIFVVVGAIIAAFSIEQFLAPNNIMDGGIVGNGMVLDVFVPLPLSVLTFLLNVPFLYVGFRQMGSLFLAKTAVGRLAANLLFVEYGDFRAIARHRFRGYCTWYRGRPCYTVRRVFGWNGDDGNTD